MSLEHTPERGADFTNAACKAHEIARAAYSVNAFCEAHAISRALFYKLLKSGDGPRIMKCATRTLISVEAAAKWRRQMEAEAA